MFCGSKIQIVEITTDTGIRYAVEKRAYFFWFYYQAYLSIAAAVTVSIEPSIFWFDRSYAIKYGIRWLTEDINTAVKALRAAHEKDMPAKTVLSRRELSLTEKELYKL